MVPCNALANMLLINRNEIWLGSLKDHLRKDLNYQVLQKELIRFFSHKRLWAMCKGRGKELWAFCFWETAKQGLCIKVQRSLWCQWFRRNPQPLKLPVFCWLKAQFISHLWISARQQSSGDAAGPPGCLRWHPQNVHRAHLSSPLLSLPGEDQPLPCALPKGGLPTCFVLQVKMQKFRVTLSEKCNFNDSSHAVYTYKWHKHGCWCTRKRRWSWKEILPPITCPFVGHTTRWAKNSGLP